MGKILFRRMTKMHGEGIMACVLRGMEQLKEYVSWVVIFDMLNNYI